MLALQALTFELRIMARKKRMLLYQHKSGFKKIVTFKMNAQEAKPGQPLAPILGQVQINVGEFIHYFNNKTAHYPKGFRLDVKLFVKWDKTYHIEIQKVSVSRLLQAYIYNDIFIDYTQEYDEDELASYDAQNYKISIFNFFKVVVIFAKKNHLSLVRSCEVVFSKLHLLRAHVDELESYDYDLALEELLSYISFNQLTFELFDLK